MMDESATGSQFGAQYDHEKATPQRIASRCVQLEKNFNEFWHRYEKNKGAPPAKVNKAVLADAVASYFADIQRLKSYHLESHRKADRFKVAGFTMEWLAKCRPIVIDESHHYTVKDADVQKIMLLANAVFAFVSALNFAKIDPNKVPPDFASELFYDLHYRSVDGKIFAQMLKLMAGVWGKVGTDKPEWKATS